MYVTSKYSNRRVCIDLSEGRARKLQNILRTMLSVKSTRWNDTFEQLLDGLDGELGFDDEKDLTLADDEEKVPF